MKQILELQPPPQDLLVAYVRVVNHIRCGATHEDTKTAQKEFGQLLEQWLQRFIIMPERSDQPCSTVEFDTVSTYEKREEECQTDELGSLPLSESTDTLDASQPLTQTEPTP
jgi:hypothetical protein